MEGGFSSSLVVFGLLTGPDHTAAPAPCLSAQALTSGLQVFMGSILADWLVLTLEGLLKSLTLTAWSDFSSVHHLAD